MENPFSEQTRRELTFQNWPHGHIGQPTIQNMAEAGFIFTGPGDTVECYACGVRISDWEPGADPKIRHLQAATDCPVVHDYGASSVVPGATGDSGPRRSTRHLADSGLGPSMGRESLSQRSRSASPAPRRYKETSERTKSFDGVDWPQHLDAQPDKLVKAGFFYIGPADRVKCAWCGGKLTNWKPKDLALEEHNRCYPDCPYIMQNIVKQTAMLLINIRQANFESDNRVSSDELIKQYAEKAKTLWRKTLKKMRYSHDMITKAEERCDRKRINLSLHSVLREIQILEKELFFGAGDPTTTAAEVSD